VDEEAHSPRWAAELEKIIILIIIMSLWSLVRKTVITCGCYK
jgi:hypothetical protein